MLKDFLRRTAIIEKSTSIADEIVSRYPPELDKSALAESKSDKKKKQFKLMKTLNQGKKEIDGAISEMGLGIYGRAKFYKNIQDIMLNKGYSEGSARKIIEELIRTF